jgi:archaellum component FlaC
MQSENSSNNTNFDNDEISLKELIFKIREWYQFLLTKGKLIILVSALGGAIGLTYAFLEKPVYYATLTFAMEDEKSGGGGLSGALGLASSFGIDLGGGAGGAFSGANLIALMNSRKIVEKTLLSPVEYKGKTISLADYYIEFNKLREDWKKDPYLKNIHFAVTSDRSNFTLQQDSILKNIFDDIATYKLSVAQTDKKISIINVTVNSIEEGFSKEFCETLAKVTSDYYIEIKSKKSRMNVEILQKQADSIRAELNSAITGVAAASDNVYNLNPAFNVKKTPSTRRQVDVQANTAILTQLVANLELSKVSLRKETPLIQVIDRPILPLDKERVSKKKSLLLGGFLAGFLTLLYLIFTSLYKKMMA